MDYFFDQIVWDWNDLLKAVLSLCAGFVLGFEREWKDKSAGFKTISIICLGSTLFSLLSFKLGAGESEDATRIASYVVSGIGFLGAGVIFKDGVNVNGLTTASIIWMSAAIGMAIGFGVYVIAAIFLLACFAIIVSGPLLNKYIIHNVVRVLTVSMHRNDLEVKDNLLKAIKPMAKHVKIKKQTMSADVLTIEMEILIDKRNIRKFERAVLENQKLTEISL
ncbi:MULTISPECIES: MgtC/SapB family protein [Sphingobacterium]|jgi:putative Mg2+ transporter-C (MgtC) family protein|uniref:MgtC/SapB family protein n=1 Tax=Sphingobacterium TaxID=28453 RepID=UPI000C0BD924|nr:MULTISPECIES: MgtC/SapB family protein [Sphingobacterium]MCT1529437.1 MgtC/SapB family protein [Sphingobacterium daejeonense]